MHAEIYCTIDQKWSPVVENEIIPPDVIATVAECGHKLPVWSETREVEDEPAKKLAKPEKEPEPPKAEPEPQPADHPPMHAGDKEEENWEQFKP
jgi:hypothetical protein